MKHATQSQYCWHKATILIMKANEMHYFSDLFDKVLYMFRTYPLSITRSISTLLASDSRQPTELA